METTGEKTKSKINWGAVIILIISAAVFIPAGGFAVIQGLRSKNPSFGTVNGKSITYEPGSNFYQNASNMARQYQAYGISINEQIYQYIISSAYNQTVIGLYRNSAVQESGYEVPEEAVNRRMVEYFSKDGVFDEKLYKSQNETVLNGLRTEIENELKDKRYVDDLYGNSTKFANKAVYGMNVSTDEKKFLTAMGTEKHAFSVASFDVADYPDTEVKKFAAENADKFTKYKFLAITTDVQESAESVLKQLQNGELTFEDAVADKSLRLFSGDDGVLTSRYRFQIEKLLDESEDAEAVLALKKDELSPVLKTKYGSQIVYTILKGTEETEAADTSSDADLSTVRSYITNNENSLIETYFLNLGKDFVDEFSVNGFDAACAKFNLEKEDVKPFSLNYGATDFADSPEGSLSSVSSNKDALLKLFSLKEKEAGEPFVLGNKVIVALCTAITNEVPAKAEETEDAEETETVKADPYESLNSKILSAEDSLGDTYLKKTGAYVDTFESAYSKVFVRQ